jgi:predicted DCC family thiol-disulfide oxidoreductase YuxK
MDKLAPPEADLIVFDSTCVFCSGLARFIARHDQANRFRFVTAHSPLGRSLYQAHGLDPDLMETNIVLTDGRAHVKMAAFAAAMRALGWPWRALAVVDWLPRRLSDPLYDLIARNRYRFGRQSCVMPGPDLKARLIE